jgi:hypothetical protein
MSTSGSYRESLARHRPNEALHLGLVVVVVRAGADERVQSARSAMAEAAAQFHKGLDLDQLAEVHPSRKLTGVFGVRPFLSRLSGPGIGAEHRGGR